MWKSVAVVAAAVVGGVSGQITSSCNPLNKTCPSDPAFPYGTTFIDFTKGESSYLSTISGESGKVTYNESGVNFIITSMDDSPTIASTDYMWWGDVKFFCRAAAGPGIVSSVVLFSNTEDEIDYEWVGYQNDYVQSNYFFQGQADGWTRGRYEKVDDVFYEFHEYEVYWTESVLEWLVDGVVVRTLKRPSNDSYPQTPCQLRLGNWVGGNPSEQQAGTIEWAGGDANMDDAPFTMTCSNITVTHFTDASDFYYVGHTGLQDSVHTNGTSDNSTSSSSTSASSTKTSSSSVESSTQSSESTTTTTSQSSEASVTSFTSTSAASSSASASSTSVQSSTNAAANAVMSVSITSFIVGMCGFVTLLL